MGFSLKPKNTPRAYFYDASITLVVSLVLIFFLINRAAGRYQLVHSGAHAEGTISCSQDAHHHYDVQFTTADGKVINYRESNWATYENGQKVMVYYDPAHPAEERNTGTFLALWDSTITLTYMSLIAVGITLGLIYFPKYFYGPFSNAYENRLKQEKKRQHAEKQPGSV